MACEMCNIKAADSDLGGNSDQITLQMKTPPFQATKRTHWLRGCRFLQKPIRQSHGETLLKQCSLLCTLTVTETEMTYRDFGRMLLSDKSDIFYSLFCKERKKHWHY